MNSNEIEEILDRILDHAPEVKRRAGKNYAHGRTDPGGLISVAALKDLVRVSFIISGQANEIDAEGFYDWVNKSGILAASTPEITGFEIRQGQKNKSKIEVCAEIPFEGRSVDEVVTDSVIAYKLLIDKLGDTFEMKGVAGTNSEEGGAPSTAEDYETYHILIADIDSDSILANVVYAEVGQEIWGCYSGYAGGGVVDYRFFHFDADYEPTIEDDFLAFPIDDQQKAEAVFTQLEATRARMEADDPEALMLSEVGQEFIDDGEVDHGSGIRSRLSEDASEDIVYDLQDEWTLLFQLQ